MCIVYICVYTHSITHGTPFCRVRGKVVVITAVQEPTQRQQQVNENEKVEFSWKLIQREFQISLPQHNNNNTNNNNNMSNSLFSQSTVISHAKLFTEHKVLPRSFILFYINTSLTLSFCFFFVQNDNDTILMCISGCLYVLSLFFLTDIHQQHGSYSFLSPLHSLVLQRLPLTSVNTITNIFTLQSCNHLNSLDGKLHLHHQHTNIRAKNKEIVNINCCSMSLGVVTVQGKFVVFAQNGQQQSNNSKILPFSNCSFSSPPASSPSFSSISDSNSVSSLLVTLDNIYARNQQLKNKKKCKYEHRSLMH